ncbi:MAG: glycosyltransferase family 9 protein [Bacteroidetes bacterium]|nr:MAG: glycosyltransferase family 9 protein [Bacteroidota bacterium]
MKILIIRFSSIGDIVWCTPVIRCLKLQLPNVELHFCTKKKFHSILEHNPYIDKFYFLEDSNSLLDFTKKLKNEKYDLVIDLHNKLRTWLIRLLLFRKTISYKKLTWRRFLYTKFQIDTMSNQLHVVDRYLQTIHYLGVTNDNKGLDYFINPKDEVEIKALPIDFQNGFVSFVIGASRFTKRLPLEKMAELCQKIHKPIILIGGKEDNKVGENLISFLNKSNFKLPIFNACGLYNISQSASIVKKSIEVYGHDTGLTHIAAAFKKKIYSIWGSTSPIGFAPYQTENVILENANLSCRPCSKSGTDICPKGHFKCLTEISFEF